MKLTIDTKEDSHEEIRNVIKMLSSLVGENTLTNKPNIFEDSSPEIKTSQENVFGNIFGDAEPTEKPKVDEPAEDTDFNNIFENKEPAEDKEIDDSEEEPKEEKDPADLVEQYF